MGMGLGHNYWVHVLKHKYGSLEECIEFMKANPPRSNKEWYELRPNIIVKEKICNEYCVDLVEIFEEK